MNIRLLFALIFLGLFMPRLFAVRQHSAEPLSHVHEFPICATAEMPEVSPAEDLDRVLEFPVQFPAEPVHGQPLPGVLLSLLIGLAAYKVFRRNARHDVPEEARSALVGGGKKFARHIRSEILREDPVCRKRQTIVLRL